MRVDLIEYATLEIPRKERFTIARGSSDVAENLFVSVHSGGVVGSGSGAPNEVTKETLLTMKEAMKTIMHGLTGFDFRTPREVVDRVDRVLPGNPSAKAAFDIAIHDLAARIAGQPLYAYLGGSRDRMLTDMTIGIMPTPDAVERARRWTQQGFRSLKVKVGTDVRADLDRLRAIRGAVGPNVEL
ncbi:MAG: enolase C-terminal domain-like protein, partial [Candidatus Thermoplasmatota archaeon]